MFLAGRRRRSHALLLASPFLEACPLPHVQVSPHRHALAALRRIVVPPVGPRLSFRHRSRGTSLLPICPRRRPRAHSVRSRRHAPGSAHARLLLRRQHPPPCRLRGGGQHPPHPRDLSPQPRTRIPLGGRARPGLVRPHRGRRPPRVRPVPFPGLVHRPAGGSAARGDRRSLTLRGQGSVAHAPRRRPASPALPRAKGRTARGPAHLDPPSGGGEDHPSANHPGDRPEVRAIPSHPADALADT